MQSFKAVKITDRVYWVGVVDWGLRNFHGYTTHKGSTYNAYLILADKVTLVDTAKVSFKEELLARIASVIDPKRIDYIISNHSEMDHTSSLPWMIEQVKPEKVFASVMGAKTLKELFHWDVEVVPVKTGDTLDLGNMKVSFIETRMLHWPDSMFTYLEDEGVLFSQDAFAMHLASSELFVDELDPGFVRREAATYYANILMPYSALILKLLKQVKEMGLRPKIVATDHGPIWRKKEDIAKILSLYEEWALQKPSKKAVVVYDTMWGSTDLMAKTIADGLREGGATAKVMPMGGSHRSDVATEVLDAGALIAGSPTLNNNLFPSMADILTYLKGLKPQNLIGAAFGSYGWSGESAKQVREFLEAIKVNVLGEVKAKHVPTQEVLQECFDLGLQIAQKLDGICKGE
jgi:flavorubredoxin